jgi:HK97 family phage major capsid protein
MELTTETIEKALGDFKKNLATKSEVKELVKSVLEHEDMKALYTPAEEAKALKQENENLTASVKSLSKQLKAIAFEQSAGNGRYNGVFSSRKNAEAMGMIALAKIFRRKFAQQYLDDNGIECKAMVGDGGSASGDIWVPSTLASDVIEMAGQYGVFRADANQYPIGRGSVSVPKATSDPEVYCPGEGKSIDESSIGADAVPLRPQGWKSLIGISNELDEDSVVALGELIGRAFARAFAKKEDQCAFVGDGTSTYFNNIGITTALRAVDSIIGNCQGLAVQGTAGAWSAIDHDDILATIALLPGEYDNADAKFYCNKKFFVTVMLAAAFSAGNAALEKEVLMTGYTREPKYSGYPVRYVSAMYGAKHSADHCPLILGNLKDGSLIGVRSEMSIARSSESGFTNDLTYIRATERVAINNHGVGDTSEAGPLVGFWADIA